jgi:flavin-binding protein dodecin
MACTSSRLVLQTLEHDPRLQRPIHRIPQPAVRSHCRRSSDPTGLVEDLFSFQLPGNDGIITTYGIDTPHHYFTNVLYYAATGVIVGATSEYSMIAWGCDANGIPYYASYSTATKSTSTPAGIDMMTTSDEGPDQATINAVVRALKKLGNEEITTLVESLTRMVQDGGRRGMLRVSLRLHLWDGVRRC